jgi:hypothetical protein
MNRSLRREVKHPAAIDELLISRARENANLSAVMSTDDLAEVK